MNDADNKLMVVDSRTTDLTQLPTEDIRQRLTSALAKTAEGLGEMAACVRELEARGEDLSSIRLAILPYLRKIAHGALLPQIVVAYAGQPRLLAAVSNLPLPDQQQLIDRGTVPVAVIDSSTGDIQTRDIDPRALSLRDIARVFSQEGIRPPAEQHIPRRVVRAGTDRKYSVKIDRTHRYLLAGKMRIPIAEVLTELAEAGGWTTLLDESQMKDLPTAACKLLPEEKQRLKALAQALQLDEREIVRRAILTWLV